MLEKIKNKFNSKKEEINKFNSISKPTNVGLNILFGILAALCIVPFIFVVIISFTSEQALQMNGYRFWPEEWSLGAYKYIFTSGSQIMRSYGITIIVTVLGTLIGLTIMTTYAYALSRKNFAYRKFFTKLIFIPMLFSGGMVASYLVVTKFLGLKNTIWALILPICVSSFHIIILRTFFKTTVPDAVVESAKIDGASEWTLFLKIVLPISLPAIATIALFLTLGFWNDWFNAMLYIDKNSLIPLQYLLIRLETSMEFLANNTAVLGTNAVEAAASMPKDTAKMAIVVITTLPIIFAYPFFQKYFVSGLTVGAVKE
ncbi:MAG: carbohydrate ABC transporter permease [Clostridium baratii]|uniref:Binding--dependent transport system inner membrane component family protein n=1 Tax=Clostridium baratii str. Sullivan TaxID=1415775 RepID=A0A0A7FXB4_9CLOT|nr:carbohydrate ABC transporter permease [Clostridium baratii]AIY84242.1 binding--dependent transport system inner membrane component family protein [Clostridium baratii str. Sullivan]MBS6007080.1 carbohydrate ABC transporter permease [Clostridium baratii]MDU1054167.1 carbohydrate ABC transporter permease [Clostridium baratii]MDU4910959.1 carbohydrate ABC transporter permease [Clostridium baratii]CUP52246.1 ABC transporter [Clostridium baratii]